MAWVTFAISACLMVVQGLLIIADVVIFLTGNRMFLEILLGEDGSSVGIALTLWVYFSFTAYAALWFVLGMGLLYASDVCAPE